jgi:hypothetical protein
VPILKCENCQRPMVPYHETQKFCTRACSDEWFQEERRQAIAWFRACGMTVVKNDDQRGVENVVAES